MNEQLLVKRYGDGYALFVKDSMSMDAAAEEIIGFKRVLKDSPEFLEFLQNMAVTAKEKMAVLDKVFENNFSNELGILIKFLIEKEETKKLNEILEYIRLTYSRGAAVNAVLTSTYPLDSDVIEKIKEHMENKIQKKINLYIDFDPALLGGVKFTVENIVYDGSIKGNLDRIRKNLKKLQITS